MLNQISPKLSFRVCKTRGSHINGFPIDLIINVFVEIHCNKLICCTLS